MDPKIPQALDEIADGYTSISRGFRQLAAAMRSQAPGQDPESLSYLDADIVELWRRLGPDNKAMLAALMRYPPGAHFTLAKASQDIEMSVPTIRARLMNLGRSLGSIGTDLSALWDISWVNDKNVYTWKGVAYRTMRDLVKQ